MLFRSNLVDSISLLFEDVFREKNEKDIYPICSFDDKPQVFYVYKESSSGQNKWEQMTNIEFEQLIKQITARYYVEFLKGWYAEYESMILENETYYETYIRYYQKISNEENYTKFKKRIYSIVKLSRD